MVSPGQPYKKRGTRRVVTVLVGLLLSILIVCSACSIAFYLNLKQQEQIGEAGLLSGIHPLAISLLSGQEGWIVGWGFSPHDLDFRRSHTENLHYSNGRWSKVSSPQVKFSSVAMTSSNDVWAGTDNGFYHWDG